MKKTLLQLGLITVSFTGIPVVSFSQTFATAQVVQRPANRNVQTQLKNVLLDLQRHYRVEIVFEDRIMVGKNVSSDILNLKSSLEKNLVHLLKNTGLRVRKIRKDTYVITEILREKSDVSNRNADVSETVPAPITSSEPRVIPVAEASTTRQADVADISISGTVTDESGAGLPGVSVVVKGTTRGTTTDGKGFYQVNVPNEQAAPTYRLWLRLRSNRNAVRKMCFTG